MKNFRNLPTHEKIKCVVGKDLLEKYGQYGCKKLNKRNKKKKAEFRVVPNSNKC